MSYTKPLVTIELEEYNSLIEKSNEISETDLMKERELYRNFASELLYYNPTFSFNNKRITEFGDRYNCEVMLSEKPLGEGGFSLTIKPKH